MASDTPGFFAELKRRHVWRVAAAYAVAAWLAVQVATQVFPFFDIPNWVVRLVVVLLAIGFPVAVALAWVYELTPEGIRRTEPADSPDARPESQRRQIGRRLNLTLVAVPLLAVALMGWRLVAVSRAPCVRAARRRAAACGHRGGNPGTFGRGAAVHERGREPGRAIFLRRPLGRPHQRALAI